MVALGICVVYQTRGPVVTGVILTGARATPVVEHVFDIKTSADSLSDQINDLVRALRSKVSGLSVEHCIIRIADFSRTPSNRQAPRNRLMIEGALVFACKDQGVRLVETLTGKDIGTTLSISKDEALALGANLDSRRKDAASAALAALDQ